MSPIITATEIGKVYGSQQVLHDVDLSVEQGEILGIIGPSGSGKSTLLRILDLIEPPSAGTLQVFGEDMPTEGSRLLELRRRMGMLFQNPIVFHMSVRKNIALGLQYRRMNAAETDRRVRSALEAVGLSRYLESRARDLSGGEQQRVALSRALVTEPDVLFLDEPTANLDPRSASTIESIVQRLNRENGTTIVLNTHDMFQGQRLCDRICVMIDGTVVQTGPSREIFGEPKNREVARFVGFENIYEGSIVSKDGELTRVAIGGLEIVSTTGSAVHAGDDVDVLIRGEEIEARARQPASAPDRTILPCTVTNITAMPPYVKVETDCGIPVEVLFTTRGAAERDLDVGQKIWVSFEADVVHVVPRRGTARDVERDVRK